MRARNALLQRKVVASAGSITLKIVDGCKWPRGWGHQDEFVGRFRIGNMLRKFKVCTLSYN